MSVAECRSRHVKPCIALARATNQDFYGRRLAATHLPDSYIAWIGRHGMRVESQQKRPASLLWHDGGSKKQYCGWSGVKVVTPRCRAADSIAADSIAADSIAADSIAADSIAADSIAADSIAADSILLLLRALFLIPEVEATATFQTSVPAMHKQTLPV
ncbi:hypothetical protein CLOP_g24684 [Closterium sp. NIES-67]|nr:hypothetical protein CLOP_g24684 [Closterium sp. NIES-67]